MQKTVVFTESLRAFVTLREALLSLYSSVPLWSLAKQVIGLSSLRNVRLRFVVRAT